jgi:hypothetical protein
MRRLCQPMWYVVWRVSYSSNTVVGSGAGLLHPPKPSSAQSDPEIVRLLKNGLDASLIASLGQLFPFHRVLPLLVLPPRLRPALTPRRLPLRLAALRRYALTI